MGEGGRGRLLEIRTVGDPVLRRKAKPVRNVNRAVRALLDDMLATMYAADGVGLAAPQVGVSKRIIVIDVGDGPVEVINPEIVSAEGEESGTEGCLSVPGKAGEVRRAARVRVTGLDRTGRRVWHEAEGLFARAFQHEIDHLDGILFTDRADRVWDVPPETTLRIVFFGTPEFAVPVLEGLVAAGCRPVAVVTRPDRPRGRGLRTRPSPVKESALRLGLRVLEPERLKDPAFLEELAGLRPDVIVTVAYGRLVPPEVLALPRRGAYNVHPSLLPRYRGPAPVHRALLDGAERTGVTVIHMTEEMDAGDIVLQQEVPVAPEDDRGALEGRLAEVGTELLLRALRLVASGEAPRRRQDPAGVTYAPALTPADEVIDWTRPAGAIVNQVRALAPTPGARTSLAGRVLKILRAEAEDAAAAPAEPGTVVALRPGAGFVVAAGEGAVLVRRVKPAGGREMEAADFLNGHPLRPGDRLGS